MPHGDTTRRANDRRTCARARVRGALMLCVLGVLGVLAVSCRERSASYQLEPERDDDRPGPRIVTVPYTVAKLPPPTPSPLAYAVVRRDVESHAEWSTRRRAACPREIIDRSEERRLYPLIDVMEGLKYITVRDTISRMTYAKRMDLTPEGRAALGTHLAEESDRRYVITIAEREYLAGKERWSHPAGREDRLHVEVEWRWRPLNAVGERLTLGVPYAFRDEMPGRASYVREGDVWRLERVWLSDDTRDYMGRVTR